MKNTQQNSRGVLRRFTITLSALALAATLVVGSAPRVRASSHSDAPLIKLDPQANLTDVYAFISLNSAGVKVLTVEVSVRPFSEPGDGVMYDSFSPDALYSIHITDPATGAETRRYDFRFSAVDSVNGNYKNLGTILRYGLGTAAGAIQIVGDAQQNFTQTYGITQTVAGASTALNASPLNVAPPNVGLLTTPGYNDVSGRAKSGASSRGGLDSYTNQTVFDLSGGQTAFAGPREDGFYADTPGIFDLLEGRILNNDAQGVDGFKGYNVLHYGIQIPVSQLTPSGYTDAFFGSQTGVGVYASVSRPRVTLRQTTTSDTSSGPFIQVDREANPLFNEVLVALADKDNYNRRSPTDDTSMFAQYATHSELAFLINFRFGTTFVVDGRVDLQAVYIPDVIRVCTTTGPVPLSGQAGFNRLGFIGGDTSTGANGPVSSGWPNGHRFGDDVVDVALTAIASGPSYATINQLGDNASANDQLYNMVFPYAGTPNAGPRHSKDSGPNIGLPTPTPIPTPAGIVRNPKVGR